MHKAENRDWDDADRRNIEGTQHHFKRLKAIKSALPCDFRYNDDSFLVDLSCHAIVE